MFLFRGRLAGLVLATFLITALSLSAETFAAAQSRDSNASARGSIRLNPGAKTVCFSLHWSRIAPPFAAHIHRGSVGVTGPIVVTLFNGQLSPGIHSARGCVRNVSPTLIKSIIRNVRGYYINIHNHPFPDGAIRFQLHRI